MSSARPEISLNLTGLRRRTTFLHHTHSGPSSPSSSVTASPFAILDRPNSNIEGCSYHRDDMDRSPISDGGISILPTEEVSEGPASASDDSNAESGPSHSSASRNVEENGARAGNEGESSKKGTGPAPMPDSQPTTQRRVRIAPPPLDTSQPRTRDVARSPTSPTTRAWYEFDLAVVVALVSPIGNWLTGGDHVKNLLLITLLIFYLHQIVEVPWMLYHAYRPRHNIRTVSLHVIELLFLTLTVLSPLLGVLFLRVVGTAIVGPEALSWFNVTLFVLATGVRPWRHLVQRLTDTAEEMQEIALENASGVRLTSRRQDINEIQTREAERARQADLLAHRIDALEKELQKMKNRMGLRQDEVYNYVDDVVEEVERRMRDSEHRLVKTMQDVDKVTAYMRRSYSAAYLEILPRWIIRTLSVPFTNENSIAFTSPRPSDEQRPGIYYQNNHTHRPSSSVNPLRTTSVVSAPSSKSAMKSSSHRTSHYTSPCGSTASAHSKKLEPIPEDEVAPPPSTHRAPHINGKSSSPTMHRSPTGPQARRSEGLVSSLIFLPFRVARSMLLWSLGHGL